MVSLCQIVGSLQNLHINFQFVGSAEVFIQKTLEVIIPQQVPFLLGIFLVKLELLEIGRADMIGGTQSVDLFNRCIQIDQSRYCFGLVCTERIQHPESFGGLHLFPGKAAPHGEIHCIDTPVDIVHCPNDIYILRDKEAIVEGRIFHQILVLGENPSRLSPISRVDGKEQLAEDLGDLTPIDFIDDKDIVLLLDGSCVGRDLPYIMFVFYTIAECSLVL